MQPIIDFHCHIYPEKIAGKATANVGKFYSIEMDEDGRTGTLKEDGNNAGITHFVVCSVATSPAQVKSINNFIASSVEESGGCMTGFGTVHPLSENMDEDVEHLVSLGLKGIKIHPDFQLFCLDSKEAESIYENARKHNLPVLIHTGDYRYDYSNPDRFIPVLEKYPDVTFIGAHFGGWSIWEDASKQLCKYKNLYVDCSSSLYAMTSTKAKELIDLYGSHRVLFGTDYPMWNPKEELERFYAIDLTDEQRANILYNNAAKLLGMK